MTHHGDITGLAGGELAAVDVVTGTPLTHLSLFSGIGGLDLAAEWAGFETVGQCEFAEYPRKVLEKHWPDVPRWKDIRHITRKKVIKTLHKRGLLHDRKLPVFIISGGFPCQPFSVAGKQKGKEDERYLWPEMLRVIRELKPRWVVGENVPGILRIAGDTVCQDLEREGYSVGIFDYEAAAVGASHRRERVFFVANAKCPERRPRESGGHVADGDYAGWEETASGIRASNTHDRARAVAYANAERESQQKGSVGEIRERACNGGEDVANTNSQRFKTSMLERNQGEQNAETRHCCSPLARNGDERIGNRWSAEPDVGRVAHGVPSRVDRLKCLGNAVVPAQAYPTFAAIAEIESAINTPAE